MPCNCQLYSNKQLHFKKDQQLYTRLCDWMSDETWKKVILLFIHDWTKENCAKHLAMRKRNPRLKIHVSQRQLYNGECVLTKKTQILAGGFMEWVFIQQQSHGETEVIAWRAAWSGISLSMCYGKGQLSNVKISSMRFVVSATSNAVNS